MNYGQDFAEFSNAARVAGTLSITDIGMLLFVGFLLVAAFMDWETREIYNLIWLSSMAIWLVCFFTQINGDQGEAMQRVKLLEAFLFGLLQQFFFCRFYGRADCHAFSCCALFLSLYGKGIYYCLLHMLFALGMLAVVQLLEQNVSRRGDLKEPVAFVPYIAITFIFVQFF